VSRARVPAVGLVLLMTLGACASASDVADSGQALEARLDPARRGYCPPEALARGLAEVAFARAASERGDAIAANAHLGRAERWADVADATPCRPAVVEPPRPPVDKPPAPPDLDGDGVPDLRDDDDDGDGINDVIDQCPAAAEDADGVEDIDGCPEAAGPHGGG